MKQPEDNKTAELALDTKRGRGRPAKEDALTPAERAKRYRDSKRASGITAPTIKSDASQKTSRLDDERSAAIAEIRRLKDELAEASRAAKEGSKWNTTAFSELNALKKQLALAEGERNAAFNANSQLFAQLEAAEAKIGNVSFKNEKMGEQIIAMNKEIDRLNMELCKKEEANTRATPVEARATPVQAKARATPVKTITTPDQT